MTMRCPALLSGRQVEKEKRQIFNIFISVPVLITQYLSNRAETRFTAVKLNQEEAGEDDHFIDHDDTVRAGQGLGCTYLLLTPCRCVNAFESVVCRALLH